MVLVDFDIFNLISMQVVELEFENVVVLWELIGFEILSVMNLGICKFESIILELSLVKLYKETVIVSS